MRIGQAAQASGVPAKMIRYYEHIGLIPAAGRLKNGYRSYDATDVHPLRFIGIARHLGYSVEGIRELLQLWSDRSRSSNQTKAAALAHVAALQTRATELADMIRLLRGFVRDYERQRRQPETIIPRRTPSARRPRSRK